MKRWTWAAVLAVLALLASVAIPQSGPGAGRWVSTGGPVGGLGYDVRIHPTTKDVMFVTDNNAGVIRSTNAGRTWQPSNAGISVKGGPTGDAYTIFSLTIDPNDPTIVWAGTNGDNSAFGVFKSVDGGLTWTQKNDGITAGAYGIVFRGFTVQGGDSSTVYAQAEVPTDPVTGHGREFNKVQGRVYKSTNGGESWSLIWSGEDLARYLVIDPTDADTLYLSAGIFDREANNSDCLNLTLSGGVYPGAGGVGVLKSTNGGASWTPVNTGLTDLYVGSLRMHPTNPLVLFAATGSNACSGGYEGHLVSGLFRTVDGGASWSKMDLPLAPGSSGEIMTAVGFSPSNPSIVYAGSSTAIFSSADGGASWARHSKPSGWEWGPAGLRAGVPIDLTVDPDDPGLVYANNYGGGVFRSTDGARTWEVWSQGYSGADIHAAVIPDVATSSVFAIGRSGPFRSPNYGVDWIGIGNGAATYAEWYAVAVQPGAPSVVLVADEHQGVILRSTDGGADFVEVLRQPSADAGDPAKREGFRALAFAPSDPSIVYAGLAKDRGTLDSMTPVGNVLYRSTDGGATFTAPTTALNGLNVYRLLVDGADASTVWAATSGGLHASVDGGASWTSRPAFAGKVVSAAAFDPSNAGRIVVAEKNVGLWISADGGGSLVAGGPFNAGLTNANPAVLALAFDPAVPGKIYAADFYSGVYVSSTGGDSWSPFPDAGMTGLTVRAVKDLALAGGVVYATTQGGGVFRFGGPAVVPSPVVNDFAERIVGTTSAPRAFTVHNTGSTTRNLSGKAVGGAQGGDFAIQNDGCTGAVAAGSLCSFEVVFSPSGVGSRAATLTIASDDPVAATYPIALSGTGTPNVSISPGSASVPPRGGQAFSASGGSGGGYVWSLTTNGSGAAIDASTGAYTAGSTGGVTDVVRVADSLGNAATRNVSVTAGVGITPAVVGLPPGGSRTFAAAGGSGAGYVWSLSTNASGGSIDAGSGAYHAGSTPDVTDVVLVTDPLGNSATATVNVTAGLSITVASTTAAPRGSLTFAASGGSGSGYTWTLVTNASGGSIDAGTGAYHAGATPSVTDVVRVTDSLSNVASQSVTITAGVSIVPSTASVAPAGSQSFTASGGSGAGYAWSFSTNASGGTIDPSTGAYVAGSSGDVTDVVRATDSLGNMATASVTVVKPVTAAAPGKSGGCGSTGGPGEWVSIVMMVGAWARARRRARSWR